MREIALMDNIPTAPKTSFHVPTFDAHRTRNKLLVHQREARLLRTAQYHNLHHGACGSESARESTHRTELRFPTLLAKEHAVRRCPRRGHTPQCVNDDGSRPKRSEKTHEEREVTWHYVPQAVRPAVLLNRSGDHRRGCSDHEESGSQDTIKKTSPASPGCVDDFLSVDLYEKHATLVEAQVWHNADQTDISTPHPPLLAAEALDVLGRAAECYWGTQLCRILRTVHEVLAPFVFASMPPQDPRRRNAYSSVEGVHNGLLHSWRSVAESLQRTLCTRNPEQTGLTATRPSTQPRSNTSSHSGNPRSAPSDEHPAEVHSPCRSGTVASSKRSTHSAPREEALLRELEETRSTFQAHLDRYLDHFLHTGQQRRATARLIDVVRESMHEMMWLSMDRIHTRNSGVENVEQGECVVVFPSRKPEPALKSEMGREGGS